MDKPKMPLVVSFGFAVTSVVELYVLLWLSRWISTLNTFSFIMLTFLIGVVVGRSWGMENFDKIQWSLKSGTLPTDDLLNAVVMGSASLLLITPGVITDAIGFLILIPAIRPVFKDILRDLVRKKIAEGQFYFFIKD